MPHAGTVRKADYHELLLQRYARRLSRRVQGLDGPARAASDPSSWVSQRHRDYLLEATRPGRSAAEWAAEQEVLRRLFANDERLHAATGILYELLFERHPHFRSLFPQSLAVQRARLGRALSFLLDNLPDEAVLGPALRRVGEEHRKFGIKPVHFEDFGDMLTEGLRRVVGPQWTDEVERAWRLAYWRGAAMIIEGLEQAELEPPFWNATVIDHQRRPGDLAVLRVRPDHPYPFRTGQHTTVETPRMPHSWRRYWLTTPPAPDGTLEFRVRALGGHGVSAMLVHHTRVGDPLRLGPARGGLTLDPASGRDVLVVASGTGLGVARALCAELAAGADDRRVTMLLGFGTDDDWADLDEMERLRLSARAPQRLTLRPVSGVASDASWFFEQAVDGWPRLADHDVYVAGSVAMTRAAVRILGQAGVPGEQVYRDRW